MFPYVTLWEKGRFFDDLTASEGAGPSAHAGGNMAPRQSSRRMLRWLKPVREKGAETPSRLAGWRRTRP